MSEAHINEYLLSFLEEKGEEMLEDIALLPFGERLAKMETVFILEQFHGLRSRDSQWCQRYSAGVPV